MRPTWFHAVAALAVLWAVVGSGIAWVRSTRPSPEKIAAFLDANPLGGRNAEQRNAVISGVAQQLLALEPAVRRVSYPLQQNARLDAFWAELSMPEKNELFSRLLPAWSRLTEEFRKLPPERRRKEMDRVARYFRERSEDGEVDAGIAGFFSVAGANMMMNDAAVDLRMQALPFLEVLLENMRFRR